MRTLLTDMNNIIDKLLNSDEPSVRFKVWVNVLGSELESAEIIKLQEEIKSSPQVTLLLSERDEAKTGRSLVNWGGTSKKRMNEFITADALYVLKRVRRLT